MDDVCPRDCEVSHVPSAWVCALRIRDGVPVLVKAASLDQLSVGSNFAADGALHELLMIPSTEDAIKIEEFWQLRKSKEEWEKEIMPFLFATIDAGQHL